MSCQELRLSRITCTLTLKLNPLAERAVMASELESWTDDSFAAMLRELRVSTPAAWREAHELLRGSLVNRARQQLPTYLTHRCDASDVVQDTLFEAVQSLPDFRGTSWNEFVAWISRIQETNALDIIRRHVLAARRSVKFEVALAAANDSDEEYCAPTVPPQSSPSQRAIRHEDVQEMLGAIERLPERQRIAVRLRCLERHSMAEVAQQLECSVGAATQLIRRGIESVRKEFELRG